MSINEKNKLYCLIKSLTKGEKRNFKLYAYRIFSHEDKHKKKLKFVQLFDAIDSMTLYDEELILNKTKDISPTQLPNLKVFLYDQILKSLRLLYTKTDISMQIREQIDFAKILYNKGLYEQSVKVLNKSKNIASQHNQYLQIQQILEFKKLIERQHITKEVEEKIKQITEETSQAACVIEKTVSLSNLSLKLYAMYLKKGYVRNIEEKKKMEKFFNKNLKNYNMSEMSFFEKLYLNQSYVWYYLMLQDFVSCYRYGQRQVNLFHQNPIMINLQPDLYIQSLNSVLSSLYFSRHYSSFCKTLDILIKLKKENKFKYNFNISTLVEIFCHTHILNKHFLGGTFSDGLKYIPKIEKFLQNYKDSLDSHRLLIFYYKIACMYFGNENYKNAIKYLNKVINQKSSTLRNDLLCFARIMNLISHYELGNHDLLEYQIRSTYRFLLKREDLQEVQKYVLQFLRKTSNINPNKLEKVFRQCRKDLKKLSNDPFEKRAFLYLDFLSWLNSKIEEKPIYNIIHEKALQENK